VIKLKKYIIPVVSCVLVGLFMGKIMFEQYKVEDKKVSANISYKVYFFQVGVYSNLENMNNAASKYDSYIYIKENDKYYVYIGMTKSEENKEKLKNYFNNLSYNVYVKELEINNEGFIQNLDQYDLLLKEADTNEEIKSVNESILATYEELMNND